MKRPVKIGIFGLGRGGDYIKSIMLNNGEIVAICDKEDSKIKRGLDMIGHDVPTYKDFDEFLNHEGMEAVFLANYFHEHTSYAIKALEKGIHVLSECTSNATMAEGVQLVRAAEKSKAFYMLAENYPFMKFNREMRRIYQGGTLGKCLFAEGEYNHPGDLNDTSMKKYLIPDSKHWRRFLPRTYYITHSLGPLMYITGAFPKRVTAMPCVCPVDHPLASNTPEQAAIVTILNDDDSVFRVTGHASFGAHENSYRVCGTMGQIENIRGDNRVLLRYNAWQKPEGVAAENCYMPEWNDPEGRLIEKSGHGGGDFLVMRTFFDAIRENKKPMFDEYFATAMASVAILGHRSLMKLGEPYDIPDFRNEDDRKKYENDYESPFYYSDGREPTIPATSRPDLGSTPEKMAAYDKAIAELKD